MIPLERDGSSLVPPGKVTVKGCPAITRSGATIDTVMSCFCVRTVEPTVAVQATAGKVRVTVWAPAISGADPTVNRAPTSPSSDATAPIRRAGMCQRPPLAVVRSTVPTGNRDWNQRWNNDSPRDEAQRVAATNAS